MIAFYIILAASPVLLLIAVAFLVFIVAGIRRGDREGLRSPASNRTDAFTRRMLGVGVRTASADEHEEA